MGEQKEDWLTTAQWLKVDNETQQIRTRQVLFTTQQTAGTHMVCSSATKAHRTRWAQVGPGQAVMLQLSSPESMAHLLQGAVNKPREPVVRW